jgi:hypothetical protein
MTIRARGSDPRRTTWLAERELPHMTIRFWSTTGSDRANSTVACQSCNCLPQSTSSRRFAEAGLAVLTFDYRHYGRSEGEPRA